MSSVIFIRDNASGAILAQLERDGRGNGDFPLQFYDKIGNNPNTQLNFSLKPEFTSESIITNVDAFNVSLGRGRGFAPDENLVNQFIREPFAKLSAELSNGMEIFIAFQNNLIESQKVKDEIIPDNIQNILNPSSIIQNVDNNKNILIPVIIGGGLLYLLTRRTKRK